MALFVVVEMEGSVVGFYQENSSVVCPEESLRVSIWEYMGAVPFIHSVPTNKGRTSLGLSFSICGLYGLYLGAGDLSDGKEIWWG